MTIRKTRYGKTFQVDANNDPLGKQVSDMLSTRLVSSQKFRRARPARMGDIQC
jgi:curli biogenesis system outer membrane secretion channel CsgG